MLAGIGVNSTAMYGVGLVYIAQPLYKKQKQLVKLLDMKAKVELFEFKIKKIDVNPKQKWEYYIEFSENNSDGFNIKLYDFCLTKGFVLLTVTNVKEQYNGYALYTIQLAHEHDRLKLKKGDILFFYTKNKP